jgi:hypothetical protein
MQKSFYSWLVRNAPASEHRSAFRAVNVRLTRGPGVAVDKKTNDSGEKNRTIPLNIEK